MTKYRTRWNEIETVECERETEAFVIINGRRIAKRSSMENFFDTYSEAVSHIIDTQRSKVKSAESRLAIESAILYKLEDQFLSYLIK